MSEKNIAIAVGIFAHNEEANIAAAIRSVINSRLKVVKLKKIVVVSSGSYDRTNRTVYELMKTDKRISLVDEAERAGKSAAVNLFLAAVKTPVVVTMSADLKLHPNALEEIGIPFLNADVGMVGAHPVPMQNKSSSIGKEIELLWELHHLVSLRSAKCGEMVAFRNIIRKIPKQSAVDEATIEVMLRLVGYSVVYAPRAIVYNRGPVNFREFLVQRRRVQAGHLWVATTYNYKVSTMQGKNIVEAISQVLCHQPFALVSLTKLTLMEAIAWVLGWIDYYLLGRNPFKWEMISRK